MKSSPSQFYSMVFKRAISGDFGQFSLDGHMLGFIVELDGKKDIGQIAEKTGISVDEIERIVDKLLGLKLIAPATPPAASVDKEFVDFLTGQLSVAIGPIATVIIEDAVADLGCDLAGFPTSKAAELVEMLSREIQREDERTEFKQRLVNKIIEKGYGG